MGTLRLTQTSPTPGQHRVQLDLDGEGLPRSAVAEFAFALADQDREDLRWYLEDYLKYPVDPAPKIAARVQARMAEVGRELFRAIFDSDSDARAVWADASCDLAGTRVEVISEVDAATALPWELLRVPATDTPVALEAAAFVRAQRQIARRAHAPRVAEGDRIRVLLVICRPAGAEDVPFHSVARHLVRVSAQARAVVQLEVLRPPTFERLSEVLRSAATAGRPYHVVHFDGHGAFVDVTASPAGGPARGWSPLVYSVVGPARAGSHGYLVFEHPSPDRGKAEQLVDGPTLGSLLAETGVAILVVNACRSAHADLAVAPEDATASSVHERVRAYGSLAQEVVDAGVAGVVAMRYNVWVVTAAQFVGDLYQALLVGLPLGQAVALGRKQLAAQPERELTLRVHRFEDWVVPIVYEPAPLVVFPARHTDGQPHITLDQPDAELAGGPLDARLPDRPDVGFLGRDETLLALDRAFDTQQVMLLHAYAGAGKTSTAAEFARWYQLTGGVQGPVLFTSFEQYTPLPRVLDQLGETFQAELEATGIHWLTLDDGQRREVAVQVLEQVPVLWIWDNVEPVAGFPTGTPSAWTAEEQAELAGFLRAMRGTKAKVLLTSRRDERGWLGELPARVRLPAMPMGERVQLARALAAKQGHRLGEVEDWRPLLAYSQGNPLTVTVLVGQALREGLRTRPQVEGFVARLRAGEQGLADDERQGRARSLGSSLGYGFTHAFDQAERAQLALLHLFQGVVDVDALTMMGNSELVGEAVAAVRDLTRERGIGLLDRAAEVGLLTGYGGGFYGIHPALPWYFAELFTEVYGPTGSPAAQQAVRAYATAIGDHGNDYNNQYEQGRRGVVGVLRAEEANLLQARRLARAHGWWGQVISAMQGLCVLYEHTGRMVEWARLVAELVPDLVDPATDGPQAGLEEEWTLINTYRVRLAHEQQRDYATAERLQRAAVAWLREQAATVLATPSAQLDTSKRVRIRNLAVGVHELGQILREQQQLVCVQAFTEALQLAQRIGDRPLEAITALNLGRAYTEVSGLRDLDAAARWYQISLDLTDEADRLGRARCVAQLGYVHWERFKEAREAGQPEAELLGHLTVASDVYHQALELTPANAVGQLAVAHHQLGLIYADAGQLEVALRHWQESIRYQEAAGNRYGAAQTRANVGAALAQRGRLGDGLLWAQAALRDYQSFGDRAAANIAQTQQLIAAIEQAMVGGRG
jgi:tetratricopeptide (TPR) repeat protein